MFQDYDGFPSSLYCESCFSEDYFDKIIEYANLGSDEREALEDFIDLGNDFDMSLFRECYCGKFDSETDFAEEIVNSCYDLERLMGDLSRYFNYEAFADELFAYDYAMGDNGYVFRR
jgi:antirestriction protein